MNERASFIPEELMRARIAQSEQLREFFIQMWLENPQMAAGAGSRVTEIMTPLAAPLAPAIPANGETVVCPLFAPYLHRSIGFTANIEGDVK